MDCLLAHLFQLGQFKLKILGIFLYFLSVSQGLISSICSFFTCTMRNIKLVLVLYLNSSLVGECPETLKSVGSVGIHKQHEV